MNKITYIFGAGASRHALPIVNEIPERIKKLIEHLESDSLSLGDSTFDSLTTKTKKDFQLEMIESLRWMMTASDNHASIDTFAKKLSITNKRDELKRLKIAMSVFFVFEQVLKEADFRYDAFFASLLTSNLRFPDHVKIISWNYDYQFELAFSEYSGQSAISKNQEMLKMYTKYDDNRNNDFSIYKLNGTTALYSHNGLTQYKEMYSKKLKPEFNKTLVDEITGNYAYATSNDGINSSLSFAWESEGNIVAKVGEGTADTLFLVVIGYSFPFFNREIDRKIIGGMTKLKRVYFQSPDADILKERFQALKDDLTGVELLSKFDVGQFLLPNEL